MSSAGAAPSEDLGSSNWGRWGADDERGTLNYVTPEHIRRFSVTGTAAELADRVRALDADGVTELAIQPGGDVADELRRLAAAFGSAGLLRSPDGS